MMEFVDSQEVADACIKSISYDSSTGEMVWRYREVKSHGDKVFNGKFAGKQAGKHSKGACYYRIGITVNGRKHLLLSHRVAWLIHYGSWPDGYIDHINHNKLDNRICNLRVVSIEGNSRNMSISKRNKSGFVGVCWIDRDKKWRAAVSGIRIGEFKNINDAIDAVINARESLDYHENHGT